MMNVDEIRNAIIALKEKVSELESAVDDKVFMTDRGHYGLLKHIIDNSLLTIDEALDNCTPDMSEEVFNAINEAMTQVKNDCVEVKNQLENETITELPDETEVMEDLDSYINEPVDTEGLTDLFATEASDSLALTA